jgi:hypothetical protein
VVLPLPVAVVSGAGRMVSRAHLHSSASRKPAMLKLNDPSLLKSQCHVDGAWIGEGVDAVDNPATGDLLAKVPRFGAEETTRRRRGRLARLQAWAKKTAKERSNILRKWFDLIIANTGRSRR